MNPVDERLAAFPTPRLKAIGRGIEKESLRAHPDGTLALTPHPAALGSALTNPNVTTDFCESQIELVTGVHAAVDACLDELTQIHQFTERSLRDDEMLWAGSMPCALPADETIPIGRYGSSNVGRAKSIYRMGLGHRYGRRMQTISGIHYNWSLPGVSSEAYFALIRNFRRHSFLLLYLFGASPAVCTTFLAGREHRLEALNDDTHYLPHATSLRMGRLGYQSDAQATLAVSYNSLDGYGASLQEALTKPYPPYEAVGIRSPGGEYNQLATSLLQIENEFYGTIRPKRVIFPGERPLHALRERGVEYVEVRCMDLDPFVPAGIDANTVRFLDVFLLHCLLNTSAPDSPAEITALARNQHRVAERGREPGLQLERDGESVSLVAWGRALVDECASIAAALDAAHETAAYSRSLVDARMGLDDPSTLPSARVLATMVRDFGGSHLAFTAAQSARTKANLLALPWADATANRFAERAAASIVEQRDIESLDSLPFEVYREQYLATRRLSPSRPRPAHDELAVNT